MNQVCFWRATLALLFLLTSCQTPARQAPPTPLQSLPAPMQPATPAPPMPAPTPLAGSVLAQLSTAEQLMQVEMPVRDLRDLTVRLRPQVAEVPLVVNATAPDYTLGAVIEFSVHDVGGNNNSQIMAELIHKTAVAYVWMEQGQTYDREAIIAAADRFSTQSYPAAVAFFGQEWQPGVDNDPRLHIVHTTGLGGGVAGYFSSADEYSRLVNPFSNEKEMFYISLTWLNNTQNYRYYETVLAHELQHMIHWHHDSNEWTWVNEGLSEFSQEVTGFGVDTTFVSAFVNKPDTQLNSWNLDPVNNGDHYGASYLLMKYLHQRFDGQVLQTLVAEPANSIEGVQLALTHAGVTDSFDAIFADWVVANYANQPDALGQTDVYGYRGFSYPAPITERIYEHYPAEPYRSSVQNYGTDYVRFDGAGQVHIRFAGATTTQLAPTQAHSGRLAWWSNKGDASDSTLTRTFDLRSLQPGTPVTMTAALWWDIEPNYDYGYVLASRDGRKWDLLPGQWTTTENPSGNSYGPGYTGKSGAAGDAPATWVADEYDLAAYAGETITVRFEYVTDDAINSAGWLVDDIAIPALDYASDFETEWGGWRSNGWLLIDNQLDQSWAVQLMEFEQDQLTNLRRFAVDANGAAQFTLTVDDGHHAVLAISALAPVTTQPAAYTLFVEE